MWCSPPLAIDQADGSLFHLAKELVVELDMWSLCADGSLEYLLPDIYGDGAFPLVHSVKLAFGSFAATGNGTAFPPNAQANAKAFVQRILQMTPRVSEVEIDSGFYFDDLSSGDQFYLCDLLAQLFQFATRVRHFSSISGTIHSHQMSLVSHLVHLSYEVSRGGSINIVHLARQCAPTLQSLSMWLSRSDETVDLIRDGNGNYVQYPQLLLLEHGGNIDIEPDILPVFRSTI
ncbi:hypothetical protein GGI06_000065 [Coemansia sp. S85]|nr:hypothetical protein GGI06_000065 [Coemansia sp. S85]